jgi:outer membrane protein|tara:strand:+ start:592 stop:1116 length:525 start_codon:yes stop_codon:yes gene_type:complete
MKSFIKVLITVIFLSISTNSFAEQKIVILDLSYVLNNSKAGKGAQDFLKKSFNDNVKKFNNLEESLKNQEKDLLTKKTVLTKEEYRNKTDELRKNVLDFQSQRRAALDKIATQRAESKDILLKKIDPLLNNYIKENNISLVVEKKSTLGGLPDIDITKLIVEQLDKELPTLNLK